MARSFLRQLCLAITELWQKAQAYRWALEVTTELEPVAANTKNHARGVCTTDVNIGEFFVANPGDNDGIALYAEKEVVFLGAQNVGAQQGCWELGPVGELTPGASVLHRPSWFKAGLVVPSGTEITIGGEGHLYANTVWSSMRNQPSGIVDTDDLRWFPLVLSGFRDLVNGTRTVTPAPVLNGFARVIVNRFSNGGGTALTVMYLPSAITGGNLAEGGQFDVYAAKADDSVNAADQSTVAWTLINGKI